MFCPRCAAHATAVIDSRITDGGRAIRRRRLCGRCKTRFTTFERQEQSALIVVKRDGTREPFQQEKLERGVWLACTKRPISQETVDRILRKLKEKWSAKSQEIASTTMGNDVMRELRKLDQVAYIRFASVHREFKDVEEFKEEVGKLFP